MNEFNKNYREEFKDKETRQIYADNFLDTLIATQIKVLREQREWTQERLAQEAEMAQERISVLEDVNYSSWTIKTLRRLANAFDLRLSVRFESFGSLLSEFEAFSRDALERPSFEDDPVFSDDFAIAAASFARPTRMSPIFQPSVGRVVRIEPGQEPNVWTAHYEFEPVQPDIIVEYQGKGTWGEVKPVSYAGNLGLYLEESPDFPVDLKAGGFVPQGNTESLQVVEGVM